MLYDKAMLHPERKERYLNIIKEIADFAKKEMEKYPEKFKSKSDIIAVAETFFN